MRSFSNKIKSKKAQAMILMVFLVFIVGSLFLVSKFLNTTNEEYEQRRKEYPWVKEHQTIKGIVVKASCSRGATLLTLEKEKYTLPNSRNHMYKDYSLCEFLEKGDSLFKNPQNDTLFIYKNEKEYYFILGEFLE